MVFRPGQRDPCTWDVARLSESIKIHSPAARVFSLSETLATSRVHGYAILHGKPFSNPLIIESYILIP